MMSHDALLARIDERTEQILDRQNEMFERLDRLDRTVYTGNGTPSLVQRIALMEQQFQQFMVVCAECRRMVYATPPKKEDGKAENSVAAVALAALESKQTITVERWKFWGAVVAGVFTFLLAVVSLVSNLAH